MVRENSPARTKVAQAAQTFPLELGGDSTSGRGTVSAWSYRTPLPRPEEESSIATCFASQPGQLSTGGHLQHRGQEALAPSTSKSDWSIGTVLSGRTGGPTFATGTTDSSQVKASFAHQDSLPCKMLHATKAKQPHKNPADKTHFL